MVMEGMASYFGNDEDNRTGWCCATPSRRPGAGSRRPAGSGILRVPIRHAVFDFIEAEWERTRSATSSSNPNQIGGNVEKVIKRASNLSAETST